MQIDVYESKQAPLQKVAITGGGRCNLTNSFAEVKSLNPVYPRGYNLMKRLFRRFDHRATMRWFEDEGVKLIVQDDQCVFPQSQDAMQVVRVLLRGIEGVRLLCARWERTLARWEDIATACPLTAGARSMTAWWSLRVGRRKLRASIS